MALPSAAAGGPGALAREAAYGLCYGTKTSQPPRTPADVVEIYKKHGISKMWLSPTPLSPLNEAVISILKLITADPELKSKMKVVLGIDYKDLQLLEGHKKAKEWVHTYIASYASVISHICVGDVIGSDDFSLPIFKDAMMNLKKLLVDPIKLSIIVNESILLGDSYTANTHPSTCHLTDMSKEILHFLTELPGLQPHPPLQLFIRIMPYFMIDSPVPVDNCILKDGAPIYMKDGNYFYRQAFDAMLDSICCALEDLKVVVGLVPVNIHVVSGWPTDGPTPYASEKYAKQYNCNLAQHIGKLTPMGKTPVDIFIYSLVDEDKLETSGEEEFKHLGVATEPYLP